MAQSFDPGALLGHSYPLEDGTRIRLRLARVSDGPAIRALIDAEAGTGGAPAELDFARLVHFDPRRHCVLAATALIDGRETLVGVGSIALDARGGVTPDLDLTDHRLGPGLGELLAAALVGRAQAIEQGRAA